MLLEAVSQHTDALFFLFYSFTYLGFILDSFYCYVFKLANLFSCGGSSAVNATQRISQFGLCRFVSLLLIWFFGTHAASPGRVGGSILAVVTSCSVESFFFFF